MKVFVGLGNPGSEYSGNRHNVGFMTVERIADHCGFGAWRKQFSSLIAAGQIGGEKVLLLKPQTFYNEAGRAVSGALRFHKLTVDDLVVFHDEIDLAPGKLRVKSGGGHAGNNGLRSIISHLSPAFLRVRIGVGHPGAKDQVAKYVLHDFPKADKLWLETLLDGIAASADRLAANDVERFQTDVAQKLSHVLKPDKPTPEPSSPAQSRASSAGQSGRGRRPKPNAPSGGKKSKGPPPKSSSSKSATPSQQHLAQQAATRRTAKSAKTKATEQTRAVETQNSSSPPPATALADRLKQWLQGKQDET